MKERERLALVLLSFGQIEGSRALSGGARGHPPPNIASGEREALDSGKSQEKIVKTLITWMGLKKIELYISVLFPFFHIKSFKNLQSLVKLAKYSLFT